MCVCICPPAIGRYLHTIVTIAIMRNVLTEMMLVVDFHETKYAIAWPDFQ